MPKLVKDADTVLRRRVTFSKVDLLSDGVIVADLEPFVFDLNQRELIQGEGIGNSSLERRPILKDGDNYVVALPSAFSLAIRRYVIEHFIETGRRHEFGMRLADAYADRLGEYPVFKELPPMPLAFTQVGGRYCADLLIAIDAGRPLQILVVVDSLDGYENGEFLGEWRDAAAEKQIIDLMRRRMADASRPPGFQGGLTVVIGCGWGRAGLGVPINLSRDWLVTGMSAHDFFSLGFSMHGSAQNLYSLLDAERRAESIGIRVSNVNGILNLHAWAWKNGGHLVPHERLNNSFLADGVGDLQLPINSLLDLRWEVAHGRDEHRRNDIYGRPVLVRRRHPTPALGASTLKSSYVEANYPMAEEAVGVFGSDRLSWWVRARFVAGSAWQTRYELGQMSFVWAERVATAISGEFPELASGHGFSFADDTTSKETKPYLSGLKSDIQ